MNLCPHCQTPLRADARFCYLCGLSISAPGLSPTAHPSDFVPTLPTPDPLLGRTLDGKYRLMARLGEGGMGTVYRAVRAHIGDEVAIKVLLQRFVADAGALERFRREARAAAILRHPNVVAIYDFGDARNETGGDVPAYIVMEIVEGASLRHLLRDEQRFAPERAINLMRDICAGVGAAHRRGIFHRDLKPDNIIVVAADEDRERETVKVVDFGIAKLKDATGATALTQTGAMIGTPYYMSPEQCLGGELDARSDVYSLGAMMYEMLAGAPPFDANTPTGVIGKHLTQPPPPFPKELNVPPALEGVVMRALSKEADARPADAGGFARELFEAERLERERLAEEARAEERRKLEAERLRLAEDAQRAEAEEQAKRAARTVPAKTVAAKTEPSSPSERKRDTINAALPSVPGLPLRTPSLPESYQTERASRTKLYVALGSIAVISLLVVAAIAAMRWSGGRTTNTTANATNPPSANANRNANVNSNFSPLDSVTAASEVRKIALSPDGQTLLATLGNGARGWQVSRNLRELWGGSSEVGRGIAINSNSGIAAVGGDDGLITLRTLNAQDEPRTLRGHRDYIFIVNFSDDGRTLTSVGGDRTVRVWNVATGRQTRAINVSSSELIVNLRACLQTRRLIGCSHANTENSSR